MKIQTYFNENELDLIRKGQLDKDRQIVNPEDSVIFHYLDDSFNESNILVRGREDLLKEINKRSGEGNYQPWCYSKIIS